MVPLVPVVEVGSIGPGTALSVALPAGEVALFNIDGTVYAIEDSCVCCGATLSKGRCAGTHVICPGCRWEYDVPTGSVCAVPDLCLRTFEVTVVAAQVMLTVADAGEMS